jgi:hypothetical protein
MELLLDYEVYKAFFISVPLFLTHISSMKIEK